MCIDKGVKMGYNIFKGNGGICMEQQEILNRIAELTETIHNLPKGYISQKRIAGKIYYYYQWSENGTKQSRYLHDDEIEPLAKRIEERKALQSELRSLRVRPARSVHSNGKQNIPIRSEVTKMKCTFMHKRVNNRPCRTQRVVD